MRFSSLLRGHIVLSLLIFVYWVTYENVLFFYASAVGGGLLLALTNGVKLLLPVCLLAYTGLPGRSLIRSNASGPYVLLFGAFLLWALVPTLIFGDPVSWLKLVPRYLFMLSCMNILAAYPAAFRVFSKGVVLYVLFALFQWAAVTLAGGGVEIRVIGGGVKMAGTAGLLGNVTSSMVMPGVGMPIYRLSGFWNEPSNAAGASFAAFFLARYLATTTDGRLWGWLSYGCAASGFLALSNSGYLAFAAALLVGVALRLRSARLSGLPATVTIVATSVLLASVALMGRSYVAEGLADSPWARAVTGVRDLSTQTVDPFGGRLDLARNTIESVSSTLIGVGVQDIGGRGGIDASASAPLFWLLQTGIPGLILLLAREAALLAAAVALARRQPKTIPIIQALVVVMTQQLIYGSWMNPNYLILAAVVLVSASQVRQNENRRTSNIGGLPWGPERDIGGGLRAGLGGTRPAATENA